MCTPHTALQSPPSTALPSFCLIHLSSLRAAHYAAPTCNYHTSRGPHNPQKSLFFFFADKSTESVVGYPSGLGMCACYRAQLGAQTGDCYIKLLVFKDKNMYTVFQNLTQKFRIFSLLKVLMCSSALVLTVGGTRVRFLARTEVLRLTEASRNPFSILPPGGKSART
jgi:hypothetical protein